MTSLIKTRFRSDLVVVPVSGGAEGFTAVIVKDLINGRRFRFNQQEFFLCKNWNGYTTVDELLDLFQQKYGTFISSIEVEAFLQGLFNEALLEPYQSSAVNEGRSNERTDYVWSTKLPTNLVSKIARHAQQFSWLGKTALILSIPATILAIGTVLKNQRILAYDLGLLKDLSLSQSISIYFGAMWFLQLLSSLLQSLVASYYGIQTTSIGIRLQLGFLPFFDSNLDNMQHLPVREKLWIYGTPLLTRLMLTNISVLVWFNSRSTGTFFSQLAIFLGICSLLQLLTRGSPLWYNEGYLWLSTYLRKANLLPQSWLLLKMLAKRQPLPQALNLLTSVSLTTLSLTSLVVSATLSLYLVTIFSGKVGTLLQGILGNASTPITLLIICILFLRFLLKTYSQLTELIQ